MAQDGRVHVRGMVLAEAPDAIRRLGLTLDAQHVAHLGGVAMQVIDTPSDDGPAGLRALDLGPDAIAPVPLARTPRGDATVPVPAHPLGAIAIDHVVVLAGDVDAAVAGFGVDARRREERDGRVYAYVVGTTCLVEVVGPVVPDGRPARLWGLGLSVADLDAAAALLGDACGDVRDAVQPGRRIATVRGQAIGLHTPTVLLTPR